MTDHEKTPQTKYKDVPKAPVPPVKKRKERSRIAVSSLFCGILAVLNLCGPTFPTSIFMGAGAVSLAYISKKDKPLTAPAVGGIVLGAAAVILCIAEFFMFRYVYDLMKKPELIPYFNAWFRQIEQFFHEQGLILS